MDHNTYHSISIDALCPRQKLEEIIPDHAVCYDKDGKEIGRIFRGRTDHYFRETSVEGKVVLGRSTVVEVLPSSDALCVSPEALEKKGWRVGVIRNGDEKGGRAEVYEYIFSPLSLSDARQLPTTPNELRKVLESLKVGEEDKVEVFEDVLYPEETKYLGPDSDFLLSLPTCMKERPGEYFILGLLKPLPVK